MKKAALLLIMAFLALSCAQAQFARSPRPLPVLRADSLALFRPAFLPVWDKRRMPVFCRLEWEWDKRAGMPLRFRLGSVDYVDWLEGKRLWER
ncbi:MAG: hypothetical protein ACK4NS_05500 [Saprospiraceae bacterium]